MCFPSTQSDLMVASEGVADYRPTVPGFASGVESVCSFATPYFREMIESLNIIAVVIDKAGRLIYSNGFLLSLTGVPARDAIGQDYFDTFVPKEERQAARDLFHKLMASNETPRMHRGQLNLRSGPPRTFAWTDSPLCGESGKRVGVARVGIDITDALKTQQALEESESRFRELTRSIDDVFWMSEWASDKLLFVNLAFERVFGRSIESLEGNALKWLDAVHPEDRPRIESLFHSPLPPRRVDAALRIVLPLGELRWIHLRAHTLEANDSRPTLVVGIAQDITRQRRAEQRILKLNEELELRVEKRTEELADTLSALREREAAVLQESAINQGVARVASAMISLERNLPDVARIVLEEACRLTGCRSGFVSELDPQTNKRRAIAIAPNPQSHNVLDSEQHAFFEATEAILEISDRAVKERAGFFTNRPSRHPAFVDISSHFIAKVSSFLCVPAIAGGKPLGEISLANKPGGFSNRDLQICEKLADLFALSIAQLHRTVELETTRDAAEAASHAKSQFLSTMSHELRSPLNVIIGLADVLSNTTLEPQQRYHLDTIRSASSLLLRLVNEVLDLARIEAGRVELETLPIDIVAIINELCEVFETSAAQKNLTLSAAIGADIPLFCLGDINRLRQILVNLVSNAVKFTNSGGIEIKVSAGVDCFSTDDAEASGLTVLRFSITDTGIGIPKNCLASIFEGFTQVDSSVARRFGGSGLGLTIARNLAHLLGGEISVESELGKGSRFDLCVPLQVAQGPCRPMKELAKRITEEPISGSRSAGNLGPSRVLLVEDSPDNQCVVAAFLQDTSVELDIASNGFDAFKMFERNRYSLVIMDIQMPVLDGMATTRLLRQWEAYSGAARTPIVALSAHAANSASDEAFAAGCDDYVTKPIRRDRFFNVVAKHLHRASYQKPVPEHEVLRNSTRSINRVDEQDASLLGIEVDPALAPFFDSFLVSVDQSITDIKECLKKGDFRKISDISHRLKGDGGTYGLDKVTHLGKTLNIAAKSANGTQVATSLDVLERYIRVIAAQRDVRL